MEFTNDRWEELCPNFYIKPMTFSATLEEDVDVKKLLGESPVEVIKKEEPKISMEGAEEVEKIDYQCLKIHKALKEKPESNGAYWCACADVMDGNVLEKCFWREVTFFNGMWCVDDGTLVLAWMALPPSQNPKDFL